MKELAARIETALEATFARGGDEDAPKGLTRALRAAVFPGGARVRPMLTLAVSEACGGDAPALSAAAAAAIELLHCASLVHDDMPCFDDAATRRGPLQRKVGAGITVEEFKKRVADGRFGHVGYCESGALLAAGMGWSLDTLGEKIEPMIADRVIKTDHVEVQPGEVAGIHQTVRGTAGGAEVIHLDLKMYVGAPDPHDGFTLDSDPPIAWRSENGVAGDPATASILVNSIDRILAVTPGLKTVLDLPTSVRNAPQTGMKLAAFY